MCVRTSTTSYGSFILTMGRSPGFGSTAADYGPIKTRFPFGSAPSVLNLASIGNSPDRSTKSTRFHFCGSTACKHRVSGSLSLPSRGPFHLSFTVLCAIGHCVPQYSGSYLVSSHFAYGALTSCGRLSQNRSAILAESIT